MHKTYWGYNAFLDVKARATRSGAAYPPLHLSTYADTFMCAVEAFDSAHLNA